MQNSKVLLALNFWLLTVAYCLLPVASPAADAPLKKMRFVQSGHTSSSWPIYVAQQKKILREKRHQIWKSSSFAAQPIWSAP